MITVHPDYTDLFKDFHTVRDFLDIEVALVRDFKNRKTGRFEINGQGFYIKKHFECGMHGVLDELFHLRIPHVGAGHEHSVLEKLSAIGILSMKVAAFGQEGYTLSGQRSFLVTDELTNVKSLEDICAEWPAKKPDPSFKRMLINQVGQIAKKLHRNGINHRDFYICHFLLDISKHSDEYKNRQPKLFLIDLHRAQQRRQVPFRWRVKDIGGLYFSAMDIGLTQRDFFRFMRIYTGKSLRQSLQEDRRLWKAVQRRAIRTYQRDFGRSPKLPNGTI